MKPHALDMYVGSLAETVLASFPKVTWQRLSAAAPAALRRGTEGAFQHSDSFERGAYERVLNGFFHHRESLREHSWLALMEDGPAGACLASRRHYYSAEQDYPYIDLVAVNPHYQGLGLGRALLTKTMSSLREDGHGSIIHAHIRRGNVASERLFQQLGFMPWPE